LSFAAGLFLELVAIFDFAVTRMPALEEAGFARFGALVCDVMPSLQDLGCQCHRPLLRLPSL
jgi:hypothetical protein